MEPVMLSSRRHSIDLTGDEAVALSPIRHLERFAGTAAVWWGSRESPEFKRQSQVFANALHGAGRLGQSTMLAGRNHFEMLEELDDPNSPLIDAMLAAASSRSG
jgi:arylformamidase